jgi:hypothetical protein
MIMDRSLVKENLNVNVNNCSTLADPERGFCQGFGNTTPPNTPTHPILSENYDQKKKKHEKRVKIMHFESEPL